MKRIVSLLASLCLLQSAHAQTTAVPEAISYQGRALTATGALMGAGTPVNRTVTFRIWDHASNSLFANLIYSEQQVVTIAEGEFSVLVGTGNAIQTSPLGYSETAKGRPTVSISSAFGGSVRYLGVTIDDDTVAVDNEVSPRQQIVSSGFAMRAKVAESVDGLAITTAMLANNSVTTTQLGEAAITTSKIATNAVTTTQIADGTITAAKIAPDTILAGNIALGAVGSSELADLSIATGDLADSSITTAKILDGTIATLDLADSSITTAKILDGTIGTLDIADGTVASADIALDTITAGDIAVGAVGTSEIIDGTVASADIALDTITAVDIAASAVGSSEILDGAVGTNDLADGVDISAGTISTTDVVKIATSTSSGALNVGTKSHSWTSLAKLTTDGAFNANDTRSGEQVSIIAAGFILCPHYSVTSDVRIKTAIHPTNGAEDLKSLLGIQITDYRHIDTVVNGDSPKKKVIAQQVESVYPIAVSKSRGVVPDIYRNAPFRDGWVEMVSSLKVGERVKLIGPSGESVTEVLEVKDGGFRTAFQPGGDKVFVYGREVSDFRSVDYDAIAMLNVSATQELARKLETVQAENAALRRDLATQKQSMEARLIALERRMSGETAAKAVSLKTVSLTK
jgi:hypothetical protein